ncbi:MAG: molecular chaperone DjiA [Parvularculaceae bacterium]
MSFWDRIVAALDEAKKRTLDAAMEALASLKARRDEAAFSMALIALSAKMAKADGVVTDDEIEAFRRFFDYPESEAAKVRMVYDLAQQDVAGFEHYVARIAKLYEAEPAVLEDVLDCLFYVAMADGVAHPREMKLLEAAADRFGLSAGAYRRIRAAHLGHDEDDPYLILGLSHDAGDRVVKDKYRALMREHHPDALTARGVPLNLVKIAENRSAAINAAYEKIMTERA